MLLDLPGQPTLVLCSIDVGLALPDGGWKTIWVTPQPVWSAPSARDQQVALTLDSSLLPRGDYLVEVVGLDGQVRESYYFRVSRM